MTTKGCDACDGALPRLRPEQCEAIVSTLDPGWSLTDEGCVLARTFDFPDYHRVMAFVNAVAWVAHRADHHPDLEVGYRRVVVRWQTHAVGGLTDTDFSCAVLVDRLLQ